MRPGSLRAWSAAWSQQAQAPVVAQGFVYL